MENNTDNNSVSTTTGGGRIDNSDGSLIRPAMPPIQYTTMPPTQYPTMTPTQYPTMHHIFHPILPPTQHPIQYPILYPNLYPTHYPPLPSTMYQNQAYSVYPPFPIQQLAANPAIPHRFSSDEQYKILSLAAAQSQHAFYRESLKVCDDMSSQATTDNANTTIPPYHPTTEVFVELSKNKVVSDAVAASPNNTLTGNSVNQCSQTNDTVLPCQSYATVSNTVGSGVEGSSLFNGVTIAKSITAISNKTNTVANKQYESNISNSFAVLNINQSVSDEVMGSATASSRNCTITDSTTIIPPTTATITTTTAPDTLCFFSNAGARKVEYPPLVAYIDLTMSDEEDEVPLKKNPCQRKSEPKKKNEGDRRINTPKGSRHPVLTRQNVANSNRTKGSRLRQLRERKPNREAEKMLTIPTRVVKISREERGQGDTMSLKRVRVKVSTDGVEETCSVKPNKQAKRASSQYHSAVHGEEISPSIEKNTSKRSGAHREVGKSEEVQVMDKNSKEMHEIVKLTTNNDIDMSFVGSSGEATLWQIGNDHFYNEMYRKVQESNQLKSPTKLKKFDKSTRLYARLFIRHLCISYTI